MVLSSISCRPLEFKQVPSTHGAHPLYQGMALAVPKTAVNGLGFIVCVRTGKTVRFVVGAPAFMRGKERFSAPGKSLDFDQAL